MEEDRDDNIEVEEEVDDNMENDLYGITLEVVDGMKEGSRWLIVNDVWPNPMLMFMSVCIPKSFWGIKIHLQR